MKKTVLLIPAYKPSLNLISLLKSIIELDINHVFKSIIVVNDGSGNEFDELFSTVKTLDSVYVLEHAINMGKGAALKTGFNHILVKYPDTVSIITADADGQHAPNDIINVALTSLDNPEAIVLGCREFGKDVPLRSSFGNLVTRYVFRAFTGLKLSDTQTGLRAWPRFLCLQGLKITINGYDFEMESLVRAKNLNGNKLKLLEVPIQTIYEEGNVSSHFNPVLDSMRIYFVFLRYIGSSMTAAIIDNTVFVVAYYVTENVAYSQFYGRFIAMLVAFVLLRQLVFKSNARWYVSLTKYVALVIAFGYLSYAAIYFMHTSFGIGIIASKLIAEAILFVTGFAVLRSLIFNKG